MTESYLSEWAFSGVHRAWRGLDAQGLASTLGAVQSVVAVIAEGRRWRCEFAEDSHDAPRSYTAFGEQRIVVSPQAVLDTSIPRGKGIDITIGWALHEGSHAKYTADLFPRIMEPRIEPLAVASLIGNLLEDTRIEALTSEAYPGFEDYFTLSNAYLWQLQAAQAPTEWKQAKDRKGLAALLNAVILMVKWPTEYEPIARADKKLSAEYDWWNDLRDRYLGGAEFRACVEEGMARLALVADKPLKAMAREERKAEREMGRLVDAINKALNDLRADGLTAPCPSELAGRLPKALAEKVNKLVRDGMLVIEPLNHVGTGKPPSIIVLHPQESGESQGYFRRPSPTLVARMREAFRLRPVARAWSTRLLRSGRVDEQQLWRVAGGDHRVFERRMIASRPDAAITLLVDQSGSMSGRKLRSAAEAAMVMHACLRDMPNTTVRVRSHTADCEDSGEGNAVVYRIWEQGEPMTRLGIMGALDHANNADGYAIEWCVRELMESPQPQRVLIVLSDGYPSASSYQGRVSGEEHVRIVTEWAERHGVTVIQVAVDEQMRPEVQGSMFRRWCQFEGLERLPGQITKLLAEAV